MPKGKHIPKHKKEDIARGFLVHNMSPLEIYVNYFDEGTVTLRRVKELCSGLTVENQDLFKDGPTRIPGRKMKHLQPEESEFLLNMFSETNCTSLRALFIKFKTDFYVYLRWLRVMKQS